MRRSVTVRVPATSANLGYAFIFWTSYKKKGPGYDCMGMSLDIWNELTVEHATQFSMMIEGEGAETIPRTAENLAVRGVRLAFLEAGQDMPPLAFFCRNAIPVGSGLGSSSASIVSGLLAGFVLLGKELPVAGVEELLQLAATIEGHIDNLSPCIYGGIQLGLHSGSRWYTSRINCPEGLQCIVFTPDTPMSTAEARAMLPAMVKREDAVYNMARCALLVHALSTGSFEELRLATEDRLHQPMRGSERVMPALFPVMKAALASGARGAFLSGAGSSILAFTDGARGDIHAQHHAERKDRQVASSMVRAAAEHKVSGRIFVTNICTKGAHVVRVQDEVVQPQLPEKSIQSYCSTRDAGLSPISFEQAVMAGLAPDGGLYVPRDIPRVDDRILESWSSLMFPELALRIMSLYIDRREVPESVLMALLQRSFETFSTTHVTPLREFEGGQTYILELFHGPTCAFKDVALQFLGNLFEFFLERRPDNGAHITVVGATSGDTGSAAIEGLRGKKNVQVFILHPHNKVSPLQEAQMTSVMDANIHNVAVEGTFDDCQDIVKSLFRDPDFRTKHCLAAINSINWARILAQIVYYFYAYFRWLEYDPANRKFGDKLTFVVPTGNFGDSLAGYYARAMGLPVEKFVVATNENDILHRFFSEGDYSARPVQPTLAPAMDIVIPSNFERYLFHLLGNDSGALKRVLEEYARSGQLDLGPRTDQLLAQAQTTFLSSRASDVEIAATMQDFKMRCSYCICPHTAAGLYARKTVADPSRCIFLATAHPAKFTAEPLVTITVPPSVPQQLLGLEQKPKRCARLENDRLAVAAYVQQTLDQHGEVAGSDPAGDWSRTILFAAGILASIAIRYGWRIW